MNEKVNASDVIAVLKQRLADAIEHEAVALARLTAAQRQNDALMETIIKLQQPKQPEQPAPEPEKS